MHDKIDVFIGNPRKSLFRLSLPIIIAMTVQIMYNLVDTAFVGRLGSDAIAALTFSFPAFFILVAVNSGIATGTSSRISRLLGARKKFAAENTAMHGLLICAIFSLLLIFSGFFLLEPLFSLFGAKGNVLALAIDYMSIILFASFFMFMSYQISTLFSAQGNMKVPMKIQIFALLFNIILDPIFIYVLGFGVKGAAIATMISFCLALLLSLFYLVKQSYLKIEYKAFRFSFAIALKILKIGVPSSLLMVLLSVYVIFINRFMAYFGIEYVAAYGVVSKLANVAVMPVIAFSIAMLTLIGMFHGAERYDLLKDISWFGLKAGVVYTLLISVLFFIVPSFFLRIFTPDISLIQIASLLLKIDVLSYPLIASTILVNRIMQGLGSGLPGMIIALIRIMVVGVPLAYLFVHVLNYAYASIVVAMFLGGIVSSLVALVWLLLRLRKLTS